MSQFQMETLKVTNDMTIIPFIVRRLTRCLNDYDRYWKQLPFYCPLESESREPPTWLK